MPKPIATWSSARDVWETGDPGLFCEHSDVFSATFPTSGMTSSGAAYALPTWEHRTAGSASSSSRPAGTLLPTPEAKLSDSGPDYARASRSGSGGDDLTTTVHRELLPTPTTQDASNTPGPESSQFDRNTPPLNALVTLFPTPVTDPDSANGHARDLRNEALTLLPTPNASDCKGSGATQGRVKDGRPRPLSDADLPEVVALLPTPTAALADGGQTSRSGDRKDELLLTGIVQEMTLFPTPRASDGEKGGPNQRGSSGDLMLPSAVVQLLPTPTAMDSQASGGSTPGDVTLTDAIVRTDLGKRPNPRHESSTGETTPPPSSDGPRSSDDPPPHPPSPAPRDSRD